MGSISLQANGIHQKDGNNCLASCSKGIIWWVQSFLPLWYRDHKDEVQHSTRAHPECRSNTCFICFCWKVDYGSTWRQICVNQGVIRQAQYHLNISWRVLPLQIIYGGKTDRCHPKDVRFPSGFCISHNEKHWSNEEETIKLIDMVIVPYIVRKRSELNLPATQKL